MHTDTPGEWGRYDYTLNNMNINLAGTLVRINVPLFTPSLFGLRFRLRVPTTLDAEHFEKL